MKKNLTRIIFITVLCVSLSCLTGCTSEIFTPLPKKVTIEKPAESSSSASVTQTETPTPTPTVTPTPTPTDAPIEMAPLNSVEIKDGIDETGLNNAQKKKVVEAANHRLDTGFYSRESLISGLISDGFSQTEAEYGADNCYVDWY